jgi:hypothetical protein
MTAGQRLIAHPRHTVLGALALGVFLGLAGCAGPDPEAQPSSPEMPAGSAAPDEPTPTSPLTEDGDGLLTLPTCETIYSGELTTALTAEGRESLGDTAAAGAGGWGSGDSVLVSLIQGAMDRVSCSWILPFSESGSTTTIIRLDAATAEFLDDHLTNTAGFTPSSAVGGTLYTLDVDGDFPYSEAHLIVDEALIATEAFGADAEALTLDAATRLSTP